MTRPAWARWVTRVSLAVALVALVFTIRDIGVHAIGRYFRRIGWWWFAVAALEVVITSLDAVAIRAFLSPEQHKVRMRTALLAQLAGRAVNAVTPTGNLGEAIKASVLTEHVSQSRAVATILLYNIVGFTVELGIVAVAAPILALVVPMPEELRVLFLVAGGLALVATVAIYMLVRRGMLAGAARLAVRLHLLSQARFTRWEARLSGVDDKLRVVAGARARDRALGIGAIATSRLTSMTLSLLILHAVGGPITLAFVAGYTVGGFAIYLAASLVPMGLGISEGGNYELFRALGENPGWGVTMVIARRVTLVAYAAIGLVLVTLSETVQRARDRQRAPAPVVPLIAPLPVARLVDGPPQLGAAPVTEARE